jgi:universal stress protein E
MKKLLVATDLSARSDRALERAIDLAHEHGAQLTIVHVIDECLPTVLLNAQEEFAKESVDEYINKIKSSYEKYLSIDISVEILQGVSYSDILTAAERVGAELLIVGIHREDTFGDLFLGTTAERCMRLGNLPVLEVKERTTGPYRRVTVGIDFSVFSRRAVELAVKLAPSAEIYLVHAYHIPFRGLLRDRRMEKNIADESERQMTTLVNEDMAALLSGLDSDVTKIEQVVQHGTPQEVILRQIKQASSDLLVVGTHGRTGVTRALLGSVAESYLRHPPCDVLAVKAY